MIKSSGCGGRPMEVVAEVESEEGAGGGSSGSLKVIDSVSPILLWIMLLLLEGEEVIVFL
jgi:hypothetical protein